MDRLLDFILYALIFVLGMLALICLGCNEDKPVKIDPVVENCQSLDKFHHISEFFKHSEYSEVRHIILAIAIVESGWLNNQRHIDFNNYFSVKDFRHPVCRKNVKSIMCLKQFESLDDNLEYMLWYFANRKYPIDEKGFMLKLEEYAEDKDHTKKVRWVANKFKNIRR